MARWLACLVPWMAMTAALAEPVPAKVQYAFQGSSFDAIKVEDRCYVTPGVAKSWGWNVTLRGDELQIACEGRLFRVPVVHINDTRHFDLEEAIKYLGAKTSWEGSTFRVLASIRSIELTDKGVEVASTIKTQPKMFKLTNPPRLVMDFYGADLEEKLIKELPSWWRVAQFGKDIVRVVIEHPGIVASNYGKLEATRLFQYELPLVCLKDPKQVTSSEILAAQKAANPNGAATQQKQPDYTFIEKPYVQRDTETETVILIPTNKELSVAPSLKYISPTQLQLAIPKAQIIDLGGGKLEGSRWVKSLSMGTNGENALLLIETTQAMAFSVTNAGKAVVLKLFRPKSADATLAGKVIVVDAGHGGRDPGANYSGVREKDVALKVTHSVIQQLSNAGASVIATRIEDTYPSLGDRARIANESNADIFVSVHINSNSKANSRSGTITFFHQQDPVARLLAECIHAEIAKVNNLPDIGVWSDRRIYQSGFKVLRDTDMPGVLLELGFINHSTDRAEMTKADFPDRIAKAVVKGIRTFLGQQEPENASN